MNDEDIAWLNQLPTAVLLEKFRSCCGSDAWCDAMLLRRPYSTAAELHLLADEAMDRLADCDWKQAFDCHPPIGDLRSLRMKFVGNQNWSAGEQSGIALASDQILTELASGNADYLAKFGFIFIICATGKTAAELLHHLKSRMTNDLSAELILAAAEQRKITHLRIDKIEGLRMNLITTHVLDVTLGLPASNVSVQLQFLEDGKFREIARGSTNQDGRIIEWVASEPFRPGVYQVRFDTAGYFASIGCTEYFFPEVIVCFEIKSTQRHHHVPLLLSPFGFSTYRGS